MKRWVRLAYTCRLRFCRQARILILAVSLQATIVATLIVTILVCQGRGRRGTAIQAATGRISRTQFLAGRIHQCLEVIR